MPERRTLSPEEAAPYLPGGGEPESALRWVGRAPFRAAGRLDVAAGVKTPEQAETRAQAYGDFFLDSILMAPLLLIQPEVPVVAGLMKATPLIGRFVPSVLQAGAAGALKGGQAAVEGKPVLPAAAMAAGGQTIAGSVAPTVLTKVAQSIPGVVRGVETRRLAQGVREIFSGPLEKLGSTELFKLTGTEGRQILAAVRRQYRDAIQQRIGNRPLLIPEFGSTPLGFDVAWKQLQSAWKDLGSEAWARAKTQLVAELNRIDQARSGRALAGHLFDAMNESYRAGRAYIKTVGAALDKSGELDTAKLMTFVNKHWDRGDRFGRTLKGEFGRYADAFERLLTRGQGAPAKIDRPARISLHELRPPWPNYAGSPAPAATPETVRGALSLLGAAEPQIPLGAAAAAWEHLPLIHRRERGFGEGAEEVR